MTLFTEGRLQAFERMMQDHSNNLEAVLYCKKRSSSYGGEVVDMSRGNGTRENNFVFSK